MLVPALTKQLMLANFGTVSSFILSSIFNQYCSNLYGIALCDVRSKMYERVKVLWRKAIRRLLHVPGRAHNWLLPLISGISTFDQVCYKRVVKFYHSLLHSDNVIVQCIAKRCMSQSVSNMGRNVTFFEKCINMSSYVCNSKCYNLVKQISIWRPSRVYMFLTFVCFWV